VIGGSSGIGAAVAARLAAAGAAVHAGSRRPPAATPPPGVAVITVDVRDYRSVVSAVSAAASDDGVLDFVVNSAGVGFYAPLGRDFSEAWREIIESSFLGAVNVCSALLDDGPDVRHYVHVGSVAAYRMSRTPGNAVYSAAKTAAALVVDHTRSTLRERGSTMRISTVAPGFVDDTMFGERFFAFDPAAARALYQPGVNLTADDVAAVIEQVIQSPSHVELNTVVVRPTLQPD
jgi:NADP-dependent 3-hydroxy acid dehydrogenase YdfG